ncbi:phosphoribosyltransferase (plasmid) [Agrobacterium vitis]|uniref:phosphoribosyltransferase n=1 Tax=Agrobacterium vitis TaxID=373 RepID=UPI003D2CA939
MFEDRAEAGRKLAEALKGYGGRQCYVLALPRGGVPVAAEISRRLHSPMSLLLVRKIGLPRYPEVAMGAVIGGKDPVVVRNEDVIERAAVTSDQFERCCHAEMAEIRRRELVYPNCFKDEDLKGRIVIVVDDGAATGATVTAAIRGLRSHNAAEIVVALPVAPASVVDVLEAEADKVVCLEMPDDFSAVGEFYADFHQLTDEEVFAHVRSALSRSP